ncbi:MAG: molybdopterin-dependent oxidoreductase [Deltaproteobacteria bacterium]
MMDEGERSKVERARWTRRELIGWLSGGAFGLASCRWLEGRPGDSRARFDGFPIGEIEGRLTPTAAFFVRDHFGVPDAARTSAANWTLSVGGDVEQPLELGLAALGGAPRLERDVTLECVGNAGRNGLGWPGSPRAFSGASSGRFFGASLADVLRRARPKPSAIEVVCEGADVGREREEPERRVFARSVPLADALSSVALLALGLGDAPLPPLHGGPLRALFPGRYATDSVKWLRRLTVVSSPFTGFYQRERYVRVSRDAPDGQPLGALRIQAEIGRPRPGARLPLGLAVDVVGAAWGGRGGAARVELSSDGGRSFHEAELLDPPDPYLWRRFRWRWTPSERGPRLLTARAFDGAGETQPLLSDEESGRSHSRSGPDRIQYANNSMPVVPVWIA